MLPRPGQVFARVLTCLATRMSMATQMLMSGYRFGPFALYLRSGELTRNGFRVRLQEKPRSLLVAFAERPGDVITRNELHERLWPDDTFVDFEDGLNTAMRKLREALGDDPQAPRFIETVRGRGYRFIAAVEPIAAHQVENGGKDHAESTLNLSIQAVSAGPVPAVLVPPLHRKSLSRAASAAIFLSSCGALGIAVFAWYWLAHTRPVLSFSNQDPILIADFENQTGDPRLDNALNTALDVSIEQSRRFNLYSRLQIESALRLMGHKPEERVTPSIGREICQRENIPGLVVPGITRTGSQYLLTAQLIDPATGATVRSYSEPAGNEDRILSALDSIATTIRTDLGESRAEIHSAHRPLPEVTTSSLTALKDYADAASLFGRGKANDAVSLYNAAVAGDPDFAMAHAALGSAYYSFYFNQPVQGEAEYRKALAISTRITDRERAWIETRYAESQGRVVDAINLYQSFLQKYPGDVLARFSYAYLLLTHGHAEESLSIFEDIARHDLGDSSVFINIAEAHDALGQWAQAIQAYEKAFAIAPSQLLAGNIDREYGFTLVRNGQEDKAEQVFSALLSDSHRYGDGERSLAFLDLYRGHYARARQHLMLALPRSKDPFSVARIRYMLAVVAAGQGNRALEIAQLDRIVASFKILGPKVPYGAFVGQAYARAGDLAKSRRMLTTVAPLVNDRSETQVAYIQLLKAEVAAASGDYQTALQFLIPPAPDDTSSTAVLTSEALAHIYQRMGKPEEAVAWYRRFLNNGNLPMLSWEPQQQLFDAHYYMALDLKQKGDRAGALSALAGLLDRWKSADSNLPLLAKTRQLQAQLVAVP